jgi:hypothetical protein
MRLLTGAASIAAAAAAFAAEPYSSYDNFSAGTTLDASRWRPLERTRLVVGGQLSLVQRDIGAQTSNAGTAGQSFGDNLRGNPAFATQLRALVTVDSAAVTGCAANPEPSDVQARVIGSYFNTGPSTPGSRVNDVIATVRLIQRSDAPAGQLRAEGVVVRCTTADCVGVELVGPIRDLGPAVFGTPYLLRVDWDQAGNRFRFRVDSNAIVNAPYSVADALPPVLAFRAVQTRTLLANCFGGPRTAGSIAARFDNVAVNASAAP